MSRIYDALQRANLDRQSAQHADAAEIAEPFAVQCAEELPPGRQDVLLDQIARHAWNPSVSALPTLGERGECIEQFRGLRTQIYQFRDQAPLKTILVSSGMPADGKTFVTANLAMSLARNKNNTVLLIDADLRKPMLHTILGTPNLPRLHINNFAPIGRLGSPSAYCRTTNRFELPRMTYAQWKKTHDSDS